MKKTLTLFSLILIFSARVDSKQPKSNRDVSLGSNQPEFQ